MWLLERFSDFPVETRSAPVYIAKASRMMFNIRLASQPSAKSRLSFIEGSSFAQGSGNESIGDILPFGYFAHRPD